MGPAVKERYEKYEDGNEGKKCNTKIRGLWSNRWQLSICWYLQYFKKKLRIYNFSFWISNPCGVCVVAGVFGGCTSKRYRGVGWMQNRASHFPQKGLCPWLWEVK